jgi:hypothetical protein
MGNHDLIPALAPCSLGFQGKSSKPSPGRGKLEKLKPRRRQTFQILGYGLSVPSFQKKLGVLRFKTKNPIHLKADWVHELHKLRPL